ncbi:MAG: Fe(3+) ABC transporter substrate-binding protein [Bacteroidota bacterium]
MLRQIIGICAVLLVVSSCKNDSTSSAEQKTSAITLYTHRHYDTDKSIFQNFEKETGIKINVVKANADELIQKLESEGDQSPADLLITVDAGRLVRAKSKGLLQSAESEILRNTIPSHLKDADNQWFGLTKRARIIAYDKNKVDAKDLSTYEALVDEKWKKRILIRASGNIYNQSLLASIIANDGKEEAKKWAAGIVQNMARKPKGNDRDQVKGILAGEGDLAIVNTYYLGKLLNSKDSMEVQAGNAVSVFFPNQSDRGAHINVSGIGVVKHAPNKEAAIKFIEYLVSKEVQETFADANYEYPVNPEAQISDLLKSWGDFVEDSLPLTKLGELNKDAVIIFDEIEWDNGPNAQ